VLGNNENIVDTLLANYYISEEQGDILMRAGESFAKMLRHSVISVDKIDGGSVYLYFLAKTSKDKPYYYYYYYKGELKIGALVKVEDGSYLSLIKYRVHLSELLQRNSLLESLKLKPSELLRFGYDFSNMKLLSHQIAIFESVGQIVDITDFAKVKFSVINLGYSMVNANHVSKQIGKEKFDSFLLWYKEELKKLDLNECDLSFENTGPLTNLEKPEFVNAGSFNKVYKPEL
jgi:hypothetical protein